jgi:uncharacterized protein YjlB
MLPMSMIEDAKKLAEQVTGIGRPSQADLLRLVRPCRPTALFFADDGKTPNNARFPFLLYREAIQFEKGLDPAAILEELFAAHAWRNSWRDGIYDYLHFHTATHETLGVARGYVRVQFGGAKGKVLTLDAGDVVVMPAGTGHQRLTASADLLVVGAYPAEGEYDEPQPREIEHAEALRRIRQVPAPAQDPVFGGNGPLRELWT